MKKIALLLPILALALGLSAHPASDVKVTTDFTAKTVEISFTHKVKDATTHFIDDVKIKLNGKQIITQVLSLQEDANGGKVKYLIPELKKGDVIDADTRCNKGGNKSGKN